MSDNMSNQQLNEYLELIAKLIESHPKEDAASIVRDAKIKKDR